jgi:hypothetical protein
MDSAGIQAATQKINTQIFLDCSIDKPDALQSDLFLQGESETFDNQLKYSSDFGFDFVNCRDDAGSSTFDVIVTFLDKEKNTVCHGIILSKLLRLNQNDLKIRLVTDILKDMTQAAVSLSQKGAKEMIKKIMGPTFLGNLNGISLTELLDMFKRDWSLSEPPNPAPGEQMEHAIASLGTHNFKIVDPTGIKMVSRDSGPSPNEVIEPIKIESSASLKTDIEHLLVNEGQAQAELVTTAGNTLDPATNPKGRSLFSSSFVNYKPGFLSSFNGIDPDVYKLELLTSRTSNTSFNCNVNIGWSDNLLANFTNFGCNMTSSATKGGIDGTSATITYNKTVFNKDINTNGKQIISIGKEFALCIGGNNEKNAELMKFLSATMTPIQQASSLSKIILKAFGDPNQLLFNISDVLHYSLLRYKSFIAKVPLDQRGVQLIKTLHGFFIDTLSKCLLITCDAMLARLAVAFRFPVALQRGSSLVHFKFTQTDEALKAICAFVTKKECVKNKLNAALVLLAKCCNYLSVYLITSSGTSPILADKPWFSLSEIIKLISVGIRSQFATIDSLKLPEDPSDVNGYSSVLSTLQQFDELYSVPLVTKNSSPIFGSPGQSRFVYHINYQRALSIAGKPFLVRTKTCPIEERAQQEPDYIKARFIFAELRTSGPPLSSSSPPPLHSNESLDMAGAAAAEANDNPGHLPTPSSTNDPPDKMQDLLSPANMNISIAASKCMTHNNSYRSNTRIDRSHLARCKRTQAGGGKTPNHIKQKGGARNNQDPDVVLEALLGIDFVSKDDPTDTTTIPFVQRNVLLFLYKLSTTTAKSQQLYEMYKKYLGIHHPPPIEDDTCVDNMLMTGIHAMVCDFIAILTNIDVGGQPPIPFDRHAKPGRVPSVLLTELKAKYSSKLHKITGYIAVVEQRISRDNADVASAGKEITEIKNKIQTVQADISKAQSVMTRAAERIRLANQAISSLRPQTSNKYTNPIKKQELGGQSQAISESDAASSNILEQEVNLTRETKNHNLAHDLYIQSQERMTEIRQSLQDAEQKHKESSECHHRNTEELGRLQHKKVVLNNKIIAIEHVLKLEDDEIRIQYSNAETSKKFRMDVEQLLAAKQTELNSQVHPINSSFDQQLQRSSAAQQPVLDVEGSITEEMKKVSESVASIINVVLSDAQSPQPPILPDDFLGFVKGLQKPENKAITVSLYSLFENIETPSSISVSKSPERFNESRGVSIKDSIAESIERSSLSIPNDGITTYEFLADNIIQVSVSPSMPRSLSSLSPSSLSSPSHNFFTGMDESVTAGSTEPTDPRLLLSLSSQSQSSSSVPNSTPLLYSLTATVTFDLSILLELIQSIISGLWGLDEYEMSNIPEKYTSEVLIERLQGVEKRIVSHITDIGESSAEQEFLKEIESNLRKLYELFDQPFVPGLDKDTARDEEFMTGTGSGEDTIYVPTFISFAYSSLESVLRCISEIELFLARDQYQLEHNYKYLSAVVSEESEVNSPLGRVEKRGTATEAGAALFKGFGLSPIKSMVLAPGEKSETGGGQGREGGGHSPNKKSSRRKPRRNTRNYQSHNKRKNHSSKKSTIRHRKSYRKNNHTIKRRKNSKGHSLRK